MSKHMDDTCIFCKIANGQIPTNSIYEDEDFNVILDASPAAKGHAIILPKTHAANIYELEEEECTKIFSVAKKCATAIQKATGCEGLNILQNNGSVAGQTVFHLHVHLIPRFHEDTVDIKWVQGETPEDAAEIAQSIRNEF